MKPTGALIGSGRSANVFDLGDGTVLRRYHDGSYDTATEVGAMRTALAQGYPVPRVLEAAGPTMVLERIDGPTMLEDLVRFPWRLGRHCRTLVALLDDLHRIPAPNDVPGPFGAGSALVHLDLHPGNVMLAATGPMVIDWTNACRGPAGIDLANTWLLLSVGVPPGGLVARATAAAGGRAFAALFKRSVDRTELDRWLRRAAADRLTDEHMRPGEVAAIRKLARLP